MSHEKTLWSFLSVLLDILGIFLPLLTESSQGALQLQAQKQSGWCGPLERSPPFPPRQSSETPWRGFIGQGGTSQPRATAV